MTFTVQDFGDLIRLLEQRPDWRADLRRLVLTEELLSLPARTDERVGRLEAAVAALTEAQRRTEEELRELARVVQELAREVRELARTQGELALTVDRIDRTQGELALTVDRIDRTQGEMALTVDRIDRIQGEMALTVDRIDRTQAEMGQTQNEMLQAQNEMRQAQNEMLQTQNEMLQTQNDMLQTQEGMLQTQNGMLNQLAQLRGESLERRYRDHAAGYFGRLLRRARVVGIDELDALLEAGLADGTLDEEAAQDVRLADLVVRGRRPGEEDEIYLVIEVSAGLDPNDVERAVLRASVLGRLRPTLAVIAGERLSDEAQALAEARGAWRAIDGQLLAPSTP